jgi:hypothetical protein
MNPYEPPKSTVAGLVAEEGLITRPSQVVLAIKLASVGVILGLIAWTMSWDYYRTLGGTASIVVNEIFTLIITIWIYYKIYAGRNWARILYLVLSLAGILLLIANGTLRALMANAPPIARISTITNTGITIAIIWLIFSSPGSAWFKRSRRAPAA